jgi:hypothetical protein
VPILVKLSQCNVLCIRSSCPTRAKTILFQVDLFENVNVRVMVPGVPASEVSLVALYEFILLRFVFPLFFSDPHTTASLPASLRLLSIRSVQSTAASVSFSFDCPVAIVFALLEAFVQSEEAHRSQCSILKVLRADRCVDGSCYHQLLGSEDLWPPRPCFLCSTLLPFSVLPRSGILHELSQCSSQRRGINQQAFYRCTVFTFLLKTHLADARTASRQALRAGPWSRQWNR